MAGESTIGKLLVEVLMEASDYSKGVVDVERKTSSMGKMLESAAKTIEGVFTKALKVGTGAIVGFGAASALMGSNFESAMSRVAAVKGINKTTEDFARLEAQARKLGATTMFSATQAAQGMEELARAGLTTEQVITASNVALRMAAASGIELADASTILASTMAQFQLEAAEAARISDVFTAATQGSLFGMRDLADAMKFAGTAGAAVGMTIEETTAAVAQFRDIGLDGSMAGTQLRSVLAALVQPTGGATAALKALGLEAADVDPTVHKLRDILIRLGEAGMTSAQAIEIFSQRAGLNVFQLATQMAESSEKHDDLLRKLQESAGTTSDTYDTMTDNVRGRLGELGSAFEETMIALFSTYTGPLKSLLESVTRFVQMVGVEINAQSGMIAESFDRTLMRLADFIDTNAQRWAMQIASVVQAVADFSSLLSSGVIPALRVILPLLDDIAIIMATIWATQKIVTFVAFLTATVIPAITATTVSLSGMGAALAAATGGLSALAAGIAVVVVGLGVLIANLGRARRETQALADAQGHAAERQKVADDVIAKGTERRLRHTQRLLLAERELALELGRLTDARAAEIDEILAMDAATAALMIRRGEMLNIGEQLFKTETLLTDLGTEGQERFAQAVESTKEALVRLREEFALAEDAAARGQIGSEISEAETKLARLRDIQASVTAGLRDEAVARDELAKLLEELDTAASAAGSAIGDLDLAQVDAAGSADVLEDAIASLREEIARVGMTEEQVIEFGLAKRREAIEAMFRERIAAEQATGDRLRELERQRQEALDLIMILGAKDRAQRAADEEYRVQQEAMRRAQDLARENERQASQSMSTQTRDNRTFWQRFAEGAESAANRIRHSMQRVRAAMQAVVGVGQALAGILERLTGFAFSLREAMEAVVSAQQEATASNAGTGLPGGIAAAQAGRLAAEQFVKTLVDNAISFIRALVSALPTLITGLIEEIPRLLGEVVRKLPMILKSLLEGIPVLISEIIGFIPSIIESLIDALPMLVQSVNTMILDLTDFIADQLPGLVQKFVDMIPELIEESTKILPEVLKGLLSGIGQIIAALISGIPDLIGGLLESIPLIIEGLIDGLIEAIPVIQQALARMIPRLIQSILEAIPAIIRSILDQIPKIIEGTISELPALINALIEGIPDLVEATVRLVPELIWAIIESIPQIIGALWRAFFQDLPRQIPGIIKAVVEALVEAVKRALLALWDILVDFFQAIFQPKKRKARKEAEQAAERAGESRPEGTTGEGGFFKDRVSGSAASGIKYVPAEATMRVHQGEAIITRDENPHIPGNTEGGRPGHNLGLGITGPGMNINLFVDGKVIDNLAVNSTNSGASSGIRQMIDRRTPGHFALSRGRFSPFGGGE